MVSNGIQWSSVDPRSPWRCPMDHRRVLVMSRSSTGYPIDPRSPWRYPMILSWSPTRTSTKWVVLWSASGTKQQRIILDVLSNLLHIRSANSILRKALVMSSRKNWMKHQWRINEVMKAIKGSEGYQDHSRTIKGSMKPWKDQKGIKIIQDHSRRPVEFASHSFRKFDPSESLGEGSLKESSRNQKKAFKNHQLINGSWKP